MNRHSLASSGSRKEPQTQGIKDLDGQNRPLSKVMTEEQQLATQIQYPRYYSMLPGL